MKSPLPPPSVQRLVPWLVAVAFFMESLDTTILNTAVPTIAAALQVTPLSLKSALTSYMLLSLAVFIPISGWVADRYGTRRVFFRARSASSPSVRCSAGWRPTLPLLVGARIVQGLGGAMMMPVGRITMVRAFPKSELVRAMSFVAIPGLIGPLFGQPLAGIGLIVGYFHWRLIFFVNLPIGLLGLYLVLRYLPDFRAERSDPIDGISASCSSGPGSRCCPTSWRSSASIRSNRPRSRSCCSFPRSSSASMCAMRSTRTIPCSS